MTRIIVIHRHPEGHGAAYVYKCARHIHEKIFDRALCWTKSGLNTDIGTSRGVDCTGTFLRGA